MPMCAVNRLEVEAVWDVKLPQSLLYTSERNNKQ